MLEPASKKKVMARVQCRVHNHTAKCLFDYMDRGNGADNKKALKSAMSLIEFIEFQIDNAILGGVR